MLVQTGFPQLCAWLPRQGQAGIEYLTVTSAIRGRVGGWQWFCATQKNPEKQNKKTNSNGITTLISSRMAEIQCLQNKQGPLGTKTKISKMQGTSQAKHGVVMEKSGWHEGGPDTDRVFKSRGVMSVVPSDFCSFAHVQSPRDS